MPPPGGGLGVLGVRSSTSMAMPDSAVVYRIRRLAACEVQLVSRSDGDLQAVLDRTQGRAVSDSLRALLRGDADSAATTLVALANRYDATAAVTNDADTADTLRNSAAAFRLDAALAVVI